MKFDKKPVTRPNFSQISSEMTFGSAIHFKEKNLTLDSATEMSSNITAVKEAHMSTHVLQRFTLKEFTVVVAS